MKTIIALAAALAVAVAGTCDATFSDGCTQEFFPGVAFPAGSPLESYKSSDFNLIVFGDFAQGNDEGGDVEGRMFVGGNVVGNLNAFSVGERLRTGGPEPSENKQPFSFVGNGDVVFNGNVYPTGNNYPCTAEQEKLAYVTNVGIADPIAKEQISTTDVTSVFDYFKQVSDSFAAAPTNAEVVLDQLKLTLDTSDNTKHRYFAQVGVNDFNAGYYWTLGVQFPANVEVILTIVDDGNQTPVVFSGGMFAASTTGRTVFNIPGPNRTVKVQAMAVEGHILAPEATFEQSGGYVRGFVVVGEVSQFLQVNKPECPNSCQCCSLCP